MQGGFIPDVILYLSYFYTKKERELRSQAESNKTLKRPPVVPTRLAWFWASNYVAEIVGAFIATGLLKLRGVNGKAGWRYLFLIEGGLTLAIGIVSFFMMPPSPTQTKSWARPKGWFTERFADLHSLHSLLTLVLIYVVDFSSEETIIVNRVLRDDPSKSNMHNRQGLSVRMIWDVLKDWRIWPIYLMGLLFLGMSLHEGFLRRIVAHARPQSRSRLRKTTSP